MIPYCILTIEDDSDREFMSKLYLSYNRLIYREIFKIVNDPWVTEDLMQEVLIKLIDRVKDLRAKDRQHLINYVITASKNKARNYMRDSCRKRESPFDDQIEWSDPHLSRDEIEVHLIQKDRLTRLISAWHKLDERSRFLLEKYYFLEMSCTEIAEELGTKPGSVRMALSRARKSAYELLK